MRNLRTRYCSKCNVWFGIPRDHRDYQWWMKLKAEYRCKKEDFLRIDCDPCPAVIKWLER